LAFVIKHDRLKLSHVLTQFQARDEEFETVELEIQEEERPPMISIEEYRKKFKISDPGPVSPGKKTEKTVKEKEKNA
jgi:hypothetical protein